MYWSWRAEEINGAKNLVMNNQKRKYITNGFINQFDVQVTSRPFNFFLYYLFQQGIYPFFDLIPYLPDCLDLGLPGVV
jgi:hypothetical protein